MPLVFCLRIIEFSRFAIQCTPDSDLCPTGSGHLKHCVELNCINELISSAVPVRRTFSKSGASKCAPLLLPPHTCACLGNISPRRSTHTLSTHITILNVSPSTVRMALFMCVYLEGSRSTVQGLGSEIKVCDTLVTCHDLMMNTWSRVFAHLCHNIGKVIRCDYWNSRRCVLCPLALQL